MIDISFDTAIEIHGKMTDVFREYGLSEEEEILVLYSALQGRLETVFGIKNFDVEYMANLIQRTQNTGR